MAKTNAAKKGKAPAKGVKRGKAKPSPAPRTSKSAAKPVATVAVAPAPAAPAPAPAPRDEMIAPRDITRLTRYGERFGPHKIDIRMLPQMLPVASNALAVCDPGAPKSWRVFHRPIAGGNSRVMLSVARSQDKEQPAALVVYVGHTQIAKWTVAHHRGQKMPKSSDQVPRCSVTTGWLAIVDAGDGPPGPIAVPSVSDITPVEIPLTDGRRALALRCGDGEYAAYWAVDAADKPVCLVVDFDVFTQKEWRAKPT